MSALLEASPEESELHRRRLLARSDELLEEVEQLRLGEQRQLPPTLGEAIRALQLRIGRPEPGNPRTVRAAQLLVFAVQQRLMATNPRNPQPRPHVGRARGTPQVTRLSRETAWKELTLPPRAAAGEPPGSRPELEWREQVELVLERSFDRWSFAQSQAVAAARAAQPAGQAVARARAAWLNYWELRCEAERLLGPSAGSRDSSSAAVTGSSEPATRAAKASRKAPSSSSPSVKAWPITAAAASVSPGASTWAS
jgi:hypothetical protein